ncbi:MAG: hypothetical protein U0931_29765 [Vulcanimicrobiota bacterium]
MTLGLSAYLYGIYDNNLGIQQTAIYAGLAFAAVGIGATLLFWLQQEVLPEWKPKFAFL